jgi:hypothetical protein
MNRMEVEARSEKSIQVEDDLTVLLNNSTSLGELAAYPVLAVTPHEPAREG